jgi:hypothetical protein
MRIIAGTFAPDQPSFLNGGLVQADGCHKIRNGYAPLGQFAAMQNGTLAAAPIGAGAYRYTGSPYLFVGTATNIYTYSSAGFTSVASGLSSTAALGLRFCPYNSLMLATNGTDPIKKFDPTSPSAMTSLGGSPPTARFLAVVRGFVVAGYAGGISLRVQWSDNGNPASWATGGSSLAGSYDMSSGGDQTGLVGGEYGLVFQETRILRMTFTGDDKVWQWDEVATDVGCIAAKSLATIGKTSFFLSSRGFMTTDGTSLEPIGTEKIDRYFQALIDRNYMDNMSAVIDPVRSLYIVTIPSANPPTSALAYNYVEKEWTTAPITSPLMFSALSLSVSLEDLDAIYGSLDAMTVSLDSNALRGGYPAMMLFSGSNVLGSLTGSPMAATFKDGLKELVPGRRSRIRSVRPLTDAASLTLTIGAADKLSGTVTETAYTTPTSGGIYRTRVSAAFTQNKVTIPAGTSWTYHMGLDVDAVDGGHA